MKCSILLISMTIQNNDYNFVVIILEVFGVRLHILGEAEEKIKASNAIFEYFLMTWSGVISIYIGGRSYEKAKMRQLKKAHKK